MIKRLFSLLAFLLLFAAPAHAQLVDTGLVARYYFDEAASGSAPTQANDASANAYHLTEINYSSGGMAWNELSGNRGLESVNTTGTQRARRGIHNTSDAFRDAMAGVQKATFEIVLRPDAMSSSGTRVFAVQNRVGGNPTIGLYAVSMTDWRLTWNGSNGTGQTFSNNDTARQVLHIVYDSTQATAANRALVYKNGSLFASVGNNSEIAQNSTLSIPSDVDLIVLNRESSGSFARSMDGVLFYAAVYNVAFTSGNVSTNNTILAADDDSPSAPPSGVRSFPLMGVGQ